MNREKTPPTDDRMSSRWWMPIGTLVAIIPLVALVSLVLSPDAYSSLLTAPFLLLGIILMFFSPVFVYYDKRYLKIASGWEPSWWYYLIPLPVIGYVLSIVYLYNRHKHLGVP